MTPSHSQPTDRLATWKWEALSRSLDEATVEAIERGRGSEKSCRLTFKLVVNWQQTRKKESKSKRQRRCFPPADTWCHSSLIFSASSSTNSTWVRPSRVSPTYSSIAFSKCLRSYFYFPPLFRSFVQASRLNREDWFIFVKYSFEFS